MARERRLERMHANYRESARNLLHYLALRRMQPHQLERRAMLGALPLAHTLPGG